jgi:IclR family acetate operon transcriptional repressor
VRRRNFVAPALPHLRALRDVTKETANLGILEEGEVVTLAQAESREIMRAISPVGGRAPVTASAMGKALLATYPDAVIIDLATRTPMRRITQKSLTSIEALMAEISNIRQNGYAIDDEEFVAGLRCVAAVVYNADTQAFFAISVSGLAGRVSMERIPVIGRQVAAAAHKLSLALGGVPPSIERE